MKIHLQPREEASWQWHRSHIKMWLDITEDYVSFKVGLTKDRPGIQHHSRFYESNYDIGRYCIMSDNTSEKDVTVNFWKQGASYAGSIVLGSSLIAQIKKLDDEYDELENDEVF